MVVEPEAYHLKQNIYAPNSNKPVLMYRDCLPIPLTEGNAKGFLEPHGWIQGGTWGHISQRHFHPNSHECYGILSGESTLLVGCGHEDDEKNGEKLEIRAGDVVVLPAGTGHCNLQSTKDFRYIGVYPEGAQKWRNEFGKKSTGIESLRQEAESVNMPGQDPVNGADGPLLRLWAE